LCAGRTRTLGTDAAFSLSPLGIEKGECWLSYQGLTLNDDQRLIDAGVRTDDEVLISLSPACPNNLNLCRVPEKPGGGKGGKKGKGGGKKGGKGKKKK